MSSKLLAKKYQIKKKIGTGAFGEVFSAINLQNKKPVAIKMERLSIKIPQLFIQAKIISQINQQNSEKLIDNGIPTIQYCGTEGTFNIMVMNLYGPSLQDLFTAQGQKFNLKTTLQLGIQMLQRIQYVHKRGFIHRDLKPANFVIGRQNSSKLYLIDFGLARNYTIEGRMHIPYKDNKSLTGTARYTSVNTHLGIEQSRRDDIQSIIYILIYFVKGQLPWQNFKTRTKKQKYQKIMMSKIQTPLQQLCNGLPSQLLQILKYSRTIEFQQEPNYIYLIELMKNALQIKGYKLDYQYCWEKNKGKQDTELQTTNLY